MVFSQKKSKIKNIADLLNNIKVDNIEYEKSDPCNQHQSNSQKEYSEYNNLNNENYFNNLKVLFPNHSNKKIKNIIASSDTFDAMINSLSKDDSVQLKPQYIYEDLVQRDIPRGNWSNFKIHSQQSPGINKKHNRNRNENVYNYPEIFLNNLSADEIIKKSKIVEKYESIDNLIAELRKGALKSQSLQFDNLNELKRKNKANEYFIFKADDYKYMKEKMNKLATMLIILEKKIKENLYFIDLHDLYSDEAIKVLDDYLKFIKFKNKQKNSKTDSHIKNGKKLRICTGSFHKACSLRPVVLKYCKDRGYNISEEGPCVVID